MFLGNAKLYSVINCVVCVGTGRLYYANTHAIIFVVDSCDVDRLETARQELMSMLEEDELQKTHILVFANKQDMKGAVSTAEVHRECL